jgi:hypothetical protein
LQEISMKRFKRGLDKALRRALGSVGVPRKGDLAALRRRVAALSARLDRAEATQIRVDPAEKS